jgi:exosortase C (VPDSG-CTERM-specific)
LKAKEQQVLAGRASPSHQAIKPSGSSARWRNLAFLTLLLSLCFCKPLYHLVRFAADSDLYSYILLVPFVSFYLGWLNRSDLALSSEPARNLALFPSVAGILTLLGYRFALRSGMDLAEQDYLAWMALAFLFFLLAIALVCLGNQNLRRFAFPFGFLAFLIPFPSVLEKGIERFLQHGSAGAADVLFSLLRTPVLRDGLAFQLPGFSMQVAPECSGIHSTMVLFVTSLIAGRLFLRSPWKRGILAFAVLPLALLRNGFRILVIGELCVHVGPHMIHSYIHKRGGPIFFVLSLIPLFLLLYFLRRSDSRFLPAEQIKQHYETDS